MSPRTLIVADDDDDIRECVASLLREEGHEVRTARNGREALAVLDELGDERCLLLLDLMMPVMSGVEVLAALASAGRLESLPVIVCTASHEPLQCDVHAVLAKPLSLEALLHALRGAGDVPAPTESSVHAIAGGPRYRRRSAG